ncbi:unnamed protein product, partial [marine sediment metagenome]
EWPMFQHDTHNTGFYTKKTSGPDVEIVGIRGGLFKVRAMIKNTGSVEATGVNWSMFGMMMERYTLGGLRTPMRFQVGRILK